MQWLCTILYKNSKILNGFTEPDSNDRVDVTIYSVFFISKYIFFAPKS